MRNATLLLLLTVCAGASAADVYRWTDEDGIVYYSDRPLPNTEPEIVDPLPLVDLGAPAVVPERADQRRHGNTPIETPDYDLSFPNLKDDATAWNDARRLPVKLRLQPPLAVERGHRLRLLMDGEVRAGPGTHSHFVLERVDRGTHTLEGQVVNAAGEVLAATPRITIHHKQRNIATGD